MKKAANLLLCMLALAALPAGISGCGKTTVSAATAKEVYDAIQASFVETYGHEAIQALPTEVNDTIFAEKFGLSPDQVEDYCGMIAGSMTNCDELLVVKAGDGEGENVRAALEQALADQKEMFGWYAVMDNVERLDAAKVVTEGDFSALLIIGVSPEDETAEVNFENDVTMAEKAFRDAVLN